MDEVGAARAHRGQVEPRQQRELLEEHRALAPGPGLAHGQARVVEGERRFRARPPGGEVVVGEQAAIRPPGRVHDLGDVQVVGEGLGDEALVEDVPGRVDLLVPAAGGGLGLIEDALVGGGQLGVAEPAPWCGNLAAGQVHLGGAGPVVAEQLGNAADGAAQGRDDGVAPARVADGVAQHIAQACDTVVAQQQHPRAERARDAGREQAVPRYQVDVEGGERPGCGGSRRRSLPVDDERLAAPGVEADDGDLTAGTGQVRLHDLQHEPRGDGRVEGVARPSPARRARPPRPASGSRPPCRTCRPARAGW